MEGGSPPLPCGASFARATKVPLCGLCDADIKMRRTNCRGSEMMWGRLIGLPHFFSDQEWGGTEYRSLLVCEERLFTCTGSFAVELAFPHFGLTGF